MNCQDFEKMVLVVAPEGFLEPVVGEPVLTHVRECARCANRLTEERALQTGMRAVVAEIAGQEAPAHIEVALLMAFREQTRAAAATPVLVRMPVKARLWSRRNLAAVAAGFILLISAVAILWAQANTSTRQRQELRASPAPPAIPENPSSAPEPKAVKVVPETAKLAAPSTQGRSPHQRAKQRLKEAEVVTEFFPLLEGDDLDSLESGQIVRVELPGSALLAAGLPVDAELASEPIKADVVLGHDGMARAIRFVR